MRARVDWLAEFPAAANPWHQDHISRLGVSMFRVLALWFVVYLLFMWWVISRDKY